MTSPVRFSSRRRSLLWGATTLSLAPAAVLAGRNPLGKPRVLLGPMLGPVTPESATLWLRMSGDYFDSTLEYTPDGLLGPWRTTEPFRASLQDDLTVRVQIDGLAPGHRYHYRVRVRGKPDRYLRGGPPSTFRTAPLGPAQFRVAFGSCARVQDDPEQPIWRALQQWQPDLFLWLGDNIYGDSLNPQVLATEYQRQRFVPAFQPLARSVPQLATWDDHDFGLDNYDHTNPIKDDALALFKQYWANPAAGTSDTPGVFFRYHYGGVDFFFLDCRYYRSENTTEDGPGKTMLGLPQLTWLKSELERSRAPFKILVSGSNWALGQNLGSDTWAGFLHERNALFEHIRERGIDGVVLLAGNTHFPYASCSPWSDYGGYDLYDLTSSALAQVVDKQAPMPANPDAPIAPDHFVRPPLLNVNNAGILDFDLTGTEPSLRFNVVDVRGRALWPWLVLRASELTNGTASWQRKRVEAFG